MRFFTPDALICIDIWDKVNNPEEHIYPSLQDDIHCFGGWIHHALQHIRDKGTRVYHYDTTGATDNFRLPYEDKRDVFINELNGFHKYDTVVLCGFHLQRCLQSVENSLKGLDYYNRPNYIYLCINLSLNYPGDMFEMKDNYCFWNNVGFTKI